MVELEGNDFLLENALKERNPRLHLLFTESVFSLQGILENYVRWFPTFTDHSGIHATQVINFCNNLVGQDNINKMNADEIYILLMSCYLHDSGMGISQHDFEDFKSSIDFGNTIVEGNNGSIQNAIRKFHHELSGCFVKKYAEFFEIPTPQHLYGIVQVSRGHRKTDLFNVEEYPSALKMDNGNTVNLAYLALLIRLADEIDIAIDRNPFVMYQDYSKYNEKDIKEFNMHRAIKHLNVLPEEFQLQVETDDEIVRADVLELVEKVRETLAYCLRVISERTQFSLPQRKVSVIFK